MDTVVPAALAEIQAALEKLKPEHEGLRDLSRLNLLPDTQREVRLSLDQYDRRVQKLTAAKAPLDALLADGYPDLAPRAIADAALQDIQDNVDTIAAARAQFVSNAPTALNLAAGTTESK
jgi:hypothetical protein